MDLFKEAAKIEFEKTCECRSSNLSCISAKKWLLNQIGVWEFQYESRDCRDKNIHPATFPISLSSRIIEQFTHEGELVLDPFVGSGTTLVSAKDLKRNALGFDLKQEYVEYANDRIKNNTSEMLTRTNQFAICDDAMKIPDYFSEPKVKLVITSPPYANLLNRNRKNKSRRGEQRKNEQYNKVEQYSQDPRDLGTMDFSTYEKSISEIFRSIKPVLLKDAHCIINITDAWIGGKRVPLHINVIKAMESAGYEFRNTIIWDRRKLVNQIGIFGWPSSYITMGTTFEYLLDFIPISKATSHQE